MIESIKRALTYEPATGYFIWAEKVARKVVVGSRAGRLTPSGYRRVGIYGREFAEHRLAWLFVYGVEPPNEVDHINGVRNDNRIVNLRLATRAENGRNVGPRPSNQLGLKGVYWNLEKGKFQARITVDGKNLYLGRYLTAEEAAAAHDRAAVEHHGTFARKNFCHG